MSWRNSLRPGSFRGAAFVTESHDAASGRRVVTHEFPQRDVPWAEDLGRKGKSWSITAFVIGPDYMAARDALEKACTAKGLGTLVHPFLGTLTVNCTDVRFSESTEEGGMARFTMDFVEAGEPLAADTRPDTGAAASGVADAVSERAGNRLLKRFDVSGFPAFVEAGSAGLLGRFAHSAEDAAQLLGGAGKALRTFESGISMFPLGALSLVRSPLNLLASVRGIVLAVASLGFTAQLRVRALRSLFVSPFSWPVAIGATPARAQERANGAALGALVTALAAAEAVRATTEMTFPSYDEAVRHRDALGDDLDRAATRAADAGDDETAADLDALRLAMVRDVTARGASLVRLYQFTPRVTEPALVIAHRLYGAVETAARADELVVRNRLRHPGFVPGGRALEVRTANG